MTTPASRPRTPEATAKGKVAGSRAPASLRTTSALDYGWWASNGPTAGYLARRTIDVLGQSAGAGRGQVRHAHVQVLRLIDCWYPPSFMRRQALIGVVLAQDQSRSPQVEPAACRG